MSRTTQLGPHGIDLAAPGGIDQLLAFHRATFGDARMEAAGDGGDGGNGGDDGKNGTAGGTGDEPKLNEHGFPDKTPVKDMAVEHQAAYWRYHAQKHETRVKSMGDYDAIKTERDALKAQSLTPDEKALEAAATKARDEAASAERARYAPRLVAAEVKASAAGRLPAETLVAITANINAANFLTSDGEVDTDKVQQFVDGLVPAGDGKKWPDTGQGHRQSSKTTGVGAGRDLFAERHPKK